MSAGDNMSRFSSASVGLAVGVITIWLFELGVGIQPPAEVATAWGTLTGAFVSFAWSRFGP